MNTQLAPTVRTKVAGAYRRKQGSRRTYSYAGTYGANAVGTWWMVSVRWEGELKGIPTGMVDRRCPSRDEITSLIEFQIEGLHQVSE